MLALQQDAPHQPAVVREIPTPQPGPGEVLVRLRAAALNHRDVWIQKGQYAGLKLPCTLGADGSGEVAALGEGVTGWQLGAGVIIYPALAWGDNERVQGPDFRVLGMPDPGTFAEYIVMPAHALRQKPDFLSWEQAAALPLGGLTAYRAAFGRARVQAGERVLVAGIGGGVALLAAQFCVARGADVWVTSGSDDKLNRALGLGIGLKGGINYNTEKWVKTLTQQAGGGFDVIIESAGGEAYNQLVDAAAPGGRIVSYGGTLGPINGLVPGKVFWKQLDLLGSSMGSYQDFDAMLQLVTDQQLVPVVDKIFALEEGEQALRYLDASQQLGKVVLEIDSTAPGGAEGAADAGAE
ncbi:zinc-binding dehydrogenase [Hymenobacter sp. RP-2-7]|uniref:Zinc-binding dehydrogenase n=1 Tax=Hymenobacter polaris TaxID=2682546 RepID=A0A7Y0FPQ3_9BACT|nr:zinc-binding dehydrogenase [Hymenobacter polaris]NML67831.1 zinc-binding dehydrogenase [Hymenobacter polaris]